MTERMPVLTKHDFETKLDYQSLGVKLDVNSTDEVPEKILEHVENMTVTKLLILKKHKQSIWEAASLLRNSKLEQGWTNGSAKKCWSCYLPTWMFLHGPIKTCQGWTSLLLNTDYF